MNLNDLETLVHERWRNIRSIYRLIVAGRFKDAWEEADEVERDAVIKLITTLDAGAVREWVKRQFEGTIFELPVPKLREHARSLGIENVNTLNRDQLLSRIKHKRDSGSA